ncbi:MAG: recombinase family protein [Candidatus Caccovivens sp.]
MKTAVVYARYSCDRQNEQSIDGQLRVCKDFADRNDIFIVQTYIDKAMTGTNDERDAFQQMLKDSDKKTWDFVLVYKLDRFSRNKYEMAIHRKHLKDNGVKILSAMENIPEGPEGVLLESLLEGMNQYYSEELSQKTKRGMNETRLQGNFIGGYVNYGYERDGAKLKINENEAEILKQIFTDYANGKKVYEIVNELNSKGLKNKGKPFRHSTIYYMLKQEKYTGVYTINNEQFDKIYPPIIDKDIYAIVKKRIDANKHGKHVDNVNYVLKGKAFCGYCGRILVSDTGTSTSGEVRRYYKCKSVKEKTQCQSQRIRKECLEELVSKAIKKMFKNSENTSMLINKIVEMHNKRSGENTTIHILLSDLSNVNKSIANIIKAIEQGIFTESTKERLEGLEQTKRELQEKLAIAKSTEKINITKEEIANYFEYSLKQCPQTMIELLVKEIKVFNDKIEIAFNYTTQNSETEHQEIFLFDDQFSFKRRSKSGNYYTKTKDIKVVVLI